MDRVTTPCFGMLGGSSGQFVVGPLIHGLLSWQQFWIFSGIALAVVAVGLVIATPAGHDARPAENRSLLSLLSPTVSSCPIRNPRGRR